MVADILLADGLDVGSLLVDRPVVVVVVVVGAAVVDDKMVEDAIVVGIPIVDSLMMVIDRDKIVGGFDNWQLVMVDDIEQLDYVQMDYGHRSDNEDEAMVDDAGQKKNVQKK